MEQLSLAGYSVPEKECFIRTTPLRFPDEPPAYYFLSNDEVDLRAISKTGDAVAAVGVANPDFFHVLSGAISRGLQFLRIVAFDINPWQLRHFYRMRQLICNSANRIDFLGQLFCIEPSKKAVEILLSFQAKAGGISGGKRGAGSAENEKCFWAEVQFDPIAFWEKYELKVEKLPNGLLIKSTTIGDFDQYAATVFTTDRDAYDVWPFSIRFGQGFLQSEESFAMLQAVLRQTPCYIVEADAAAHLDLLLLNMRYEPILLWASNIFTEYFVEKHPPLRETAAKIAGYGSELKRLPQMDIESVSDLRCPSLLNVRRRGLLARWRMSPHYKTFQVVRKFLREGQSLEVVNVPEWVRQDGGTSKFPWCNYALLEDFLQDGFEEQRFGTIVLHILLGHHADKAIFLAAFDKATRLGGRVLVLEHNARSLDFLFQRVPEAADVLNELPEPANTMAIPGKWSNKRNVLYLYEF